MSDPSSARLKASAVDAATADAVAAYLQKHRGDYVDFVSRLARFESPSTDPDSQEDVQRLVAEALVEIGFEARHLSGETSGGALYAHPGPRSEEAPRQLLLGHSDTVWPKGTLDAMPVVVEDGTVRGPGVFDMKGGIASIVFAFRALDALGLNPTVSPQVLLTSDEELGSPESRPLIERLARRSNRVYVLEPALGPDGKIKTVRKGTGEVELLVRSPTPPPDGDVMLELSRLVQRLYELHDPERGVTINVGTITGQQGEDGAASAHGQLGVDVRVPTLGDAERLEATFRDLSARAPGVEIEVKGGLERPPLERTPRNRRLWRWAQQVGAHLDLGLEEGRAGGGSDGNFTSLHTATLDGLGAVGGGAHADHEFIHVGRTLDRCALLALLLLVPRDPGPREASEGDE